MGFRSTLEDNVMNLQALQELPREEAPPSFPLLICEKWFEDWLKMILFASIIASLPIYAGAGLAVAKYPLMLAAVMVVVIIFGRLWTYLGWQWQLEQETICLGLNQRCDIVEDFISRVCVTFTFAKNDPNDFLPVFGECRHNQLFGRKWRKFKAFRVKKGDIVKTDYGFWVKVVDLNQNKPPRQSITLRIVGLRRPRLLLRF